MEKTRKTILAVFISGFVIGFIVSSSVFYKPNSEQKTASEEITDNENENTVTVKERKEDTPRTTTTQNNLVYVKDQKAGNSVFLSRVELTQDGWVAIQEIEKGLPTNILGTRRFDSGIHQGAVTLLRETVPGAQYRAVLYIDDGDKEFNLEKDTIYTDSTGNIIAIVFETY